MRAIRKLWSVISTVLVVVIVLLAIALVGVRVVGLTPFAVLSGSMEPTYHVGALIYVKDVEPEDVEIGMPITFVVNEDLLVATHRVVDIEVFTTKQEKVVDENGKPVLDEKGKEQFVEVPLDEPSYYYQTKGDANNDVDGTPVYYKNLIGTPVFSLPYLGYLSSWLQTRQGMIMGISIALVLVLLTFMPDILAMLDEEPADSKKSAKDKKKGKGEGDSEEAPAAEATSEAEEAPAADEPETH